MTLVDGTPGAEISGYVYYCQSGEAFSQPPGNFDLELTGDYIDCEPWGTMSATAPGYLQSPIAGINF
jgi:hypothetical protein